MNWEINLKNFKKGKRLNKGGFGVVYEARSKIPDENKKYKIYAAKILDCGDDEEQCNKLIEREVGIMMCVNHPTIIKFIGYSKLDFHNENNLTIIMELAKNGSLSDVLKSIQQNNGPSNYTNTTRQIILIGISRGMKYLHDLNIIHRDLKAGNILLDDDFYPHIADFGMSKFYEVGHSYSQSLFGGTLPYMAPEIIENSKYDKKVDVYAFGILMFEIVTDLQPYPDLEKGKMNDLQFRNDVVYKNYRPKFLFKINNNLQQLITQCWSHNPLERPSFNDIFNKLSDYKSKKYFIESVDIDDIRNYVQDINEFTNPTEKILLHKIASIEEKNKKLAQENELLKKKNEQIENKKKDESTNKKELQNSNSSRKAIDSTKKKVETKPIQKVETKPIQKDETKPIQKVETKPIQKVGNRSNQEVGNRSNQEVESKTIQKVINKPIQKGELAEFNNLTFLQQISKSKEMSRSSNIFVSSFFNKVNKLLNNLMQYNELPIAIIENGKTKLNDITKDCSIKIYEPTIREIISKGPKYSTVITKLTSLFSDFNKVIVELNFNSSKNYDHSIITKQLMQYNRSSKSINFMVHVIIESFCYDSGSLESNMFYHYITLTDSIEDQIHDGTFKDQKYLRGITIPNKVKHIGNCCFQGCSSLQEITLPSLITTISDSFFEGCSSLKEIKIPSSVVSIECNAFNGCTSLAQITIPPSLKAINNFAFVGCSSLKQIKIPSSVISIGTRAFEKCTSLKLINISPSMIFIKNSTFLNCTSLTKVTIPPSIKSIGANAFQDCVSLQEITFSNYVTIGCSAFSNCSSLEKISNTQYVTSIESHAFSHCSSLTSAYFDNATSIGDSAFSYCTSLKYASFSQITSFGNACFSHCSSLIDISFPKATSISPYLFTECTYIFRITIPSSVTSIGCNAFEGCTSLHYVDLPPTITSIGQAAFKDCCSLNDITIPPLVKGIYFQVFSGCSSIIRFKIPPTVSFLETRSFENCMSFEEVEIPSTVDVRPGAFYNCPNLYKLFISENKTYIRLNSVFD